MIYGSTPAPLFFRFFSQQAIVQATDALMEDQKHFTGPIDSWLTSFVKWASASDEFR